MLHIKPIPAFTDNYIWLMRQTETAYCIVVDPGDAMPVVDYLIAEQLELAGILLTHHHADHCGGADLLRERFNVPVYGPARESIAAVTHVVDQNTKLTLPKLNGQLQVFDIPGHTTGHVAYYGEGVLFCGDTLFLAGCGRLFEGTAEQMYHSLCLLADLPAATQVYCGHEYTLANLKFAAVVEPENTAIKQRIAYVTAQRNAGQPSAPASLAIEKATNPFLRCHLASVTQSVQKFANTLLPAPVDVFHALRQWKDGFK